MCYCGIVKGGQPNGFPNGICIMLFEVCDGVVYVGSEKGISDCEIYVHARANEIAHAMDLRDIRNKVDELNAQGLRDTAEHKVYMEAYWIGSDLLDRVYREENEPKLWAYYEKHKNDEGDFHDWWDFFSDWHKDVYGVRPHWGNPRGF